MIKRRKFIAGVIIFCLCISMFKIATNSEAAQDEISITEFYNNGVLGDGYLKAVAGTIVTISNVEEMRIFFKCLTNAYWTREISFRQEADISFSDCTFNYDSKEEMIGIYSGNRLLGAADRNGELFQTYSGERKTTLMNMGISDAYIERQRQEFYGTYDGHGFSISGFILSNYDTMHNGIFGHMMPYTSVRNLHIKNCFLLNASGVFAGVNEGTISDCSTEYLVGLGGQIGGISECSTSLISRCKVSHSTLVNSEALLGIPPRLGGIVASLYCGDIKDCATEDLQIFAYNEVPTYVGGIAGYFNVGKMYDCSSYGNYTVSQKGRSCAAGGIVGYLASYETDVVITNCLSAGTLSGRIVGGIVGRCGANEANETPATETIRNCVSYSKLNGNVKGGLVGSLEEGSFIACYYYHELANSEMAGQKITGSFEDCHAVNQAQIFGTDSAETIDYNSIYSNTPQLLTALNAWIAVNNGYFRWEKGTLGYPILKLELYNAPKGDYVLGDGIDSALPDIATPSVSPSTAPIFIERPAPSGSSSPSPSKIPEASASPSKIPEASASPSKIPEASVSPSAVPELPVPSPGQKEDVLTKKQLAIKKLKIKLTESLQVKLTWDKNKWASGYQILRSTKEFSGYKVIGTISATKHSYVDKKAEGGRLYYYMVKAYGKQGKKKIYGEGLKKEIRMAWYKAPQIKLSKGKISKGKSYVQVRVLKYSGTYIEVYFKADGKKYVLAPLKNKKISAYHDKLRFSYKKKAVLYCKVRTYQIKRGKRCYSVFSKEKKIRL